MTARGSGTNERESEMNAGSEVSRGHAQVEVKDGSSAPLSAPLDERRMVSLLSGTTDTLPPALSVTGPCGLGQGRPHSPHSN